MIELRITPDQALALLQLIEREETLYAQGPLAPARIHRLREVNTVIDMKLEERFAEEEE